ncbi:MAG: Rrf2 family transcriptional regulator [Acidobacteriota bacterium]|jgi:Rrf2 family protein
MPLISKKARYALHGLGYLAHAAGGSPVPFQEILAYLRAYSQRLTLSPPYIAKVFHEVSRAGFVEAVPGPGGGYRLARPAKEIPLIRIVEALDGPVLTECCLLSVGSCPQDGACGFGGLVQEAEQQFYDFFRRETVASLARKMQFPSPDAIRKAGAADR